MIFEQITLKKTRVICKIGIYLVWISAILYILINSFIQIFTLKSVRFLADETLAILPEEIAEKIVLLAPLSIVAEGFMAVLSAIVASAILAIAISSIDSRNFQAVALRERLRQQRENY